jgi:kynurenine 3-monooxygenase
MGSTNAAGRIVIVGAGLTGPLLAILLADRGFQVELYERRPDMRKAGFSGGRSINLAISTRGIYALSQAGVWEQMRRIVTPMRGRMMHSVQGELTFQPYGKDESEVIHSVSRAELSMALMSAAEERGVTIRFNQRCTGMDFTSGVVRFCDEETRADRLVAAGTVIAADGSASAIRSDMIKHGWFNYSQEYLDYGYKELTIPAGPGGAHLMETHALHIWPRGSHMLIALPNIDGTFACILFLAFADPRKTGRLAPHEFSDAAPGGGAGDAPLCALEEPRKTGRLAPHEFSDASFEALDSEAEVRQFFETHFPDVTPLMPDLTRNYFANPTGAMVTVRCFPWRVEGKCLLIGDAAHAIVPFFGQGINCGFEDCSILLENLDRHGADWPRVFAEFQQARKANTDAIADLALENFIEMRDRVADPRFLFRKKVELALEAKYPEVFVPKYAMVTFRRVPYAVARARGQVQDRILAELCAGVDRVEDLDWSKADALIRGAEEERRL